MSPRAGRARRPVPCFPHIARGDCGVRGGGSGCRAGTELGQSGGMDRKPDSLAIIQRRAALRRWCILAGLALAPLPAFHASPDGFLYYLIESPPPGWTRFAKDQMIFFVLLGLPLTPIFLAWALPGAGHPGLPKRTIVALCFLVAYNPLRYYFERNLYGEKVAVMVIYTESWTNGLIFRHLDSLILVGLATVALICRHTLQPLPKILFQWTLFVCVLWAAGPPFLDSYFYGLWSF